MNYCTSCGSKLVEKPSGRYDDETGKVVYMKICPNTECEWGCYCNGGHKIPLFSYTCKRCGTIVL